MKRCLVFTCEHASSAVPKRFQTLFSKDGAIVKTHIGFDIGALHYARLLAASCNAPLFSGSFTRLLVDLNRSLHHPRLFSERTRALAERGRQKIIDHYYLPYRARVLRYIEKKIASGFCVLHISCHTFTPVFSGAERSLDVGILYDPRRKAEGVVAYQISSMLKEGTSMRIRHNAPYKGISDGHVTFLRKQFPEEQYLGLELEVNQALYVPKVSKLWQHVWLPRLIEGIQFLVHQE